MRSTAFPGEQQLLGMLAAIRAATRLRMPS